MPNNTISFHLSDAELEKWRLIAKGAIAMISIMHRKSGFWPYPPLRAEVDDFFGKSPEIAFSDQEAGSFTVTYMSLCALRELSRDCPPKFLHDVDDRLKLSFPIYGRQGPGAPVAVVSSARHTAFALLTRYKFFPALATVDSEPSISFLLKAQLETTGGWKYREIDPEDQAFATAACIAALATYVDRTRKSLATPSVRDGFDGRMIPAVATAINRGLQRLFEMQSEEGLWKGQLNQSNQLFGSANILDLLSLPVVAQVTDEGSKLTAKLGVMRKRLAGMRLQRGWPSTHGDPGLTVVSTIQVLFTLFDLLDKDERDADHKTLEEVTKYIANEMISQEGGLALNSWDWAMLGRLCALILARTGSFLSERDIREAFLAAESLKERSKLVQVVVLASHPFFKPWEKSAVYVVSRGSPDGWMPAIATIGAVLTAVPYAKKVFRWWVERNAWIAQVLSMPDRIEDRFRYDPPENGTRTGNQTKNETTQEVASVANSIKRVFLSYSSKDRGVADAVKGALTAAGLDVWIDYNVIKPGDHISSSILDELDRTDCFVSLISENSNNSPWVKREIAIAFDLSNRKKLAVVPMLIAKVDAPFEFRGLLYIDASNRIEDGIAQLIDFIRSQQSTAAGLDHAVRPLSLILGTDDAKSSPPETPLPPSPRP